MKTFWTVTVVVAVAASAAFAGRGSLRPAHHTDALASGLQEKIVAQERKELEALKSANAAEFAGLIADDAVFVDSRGSAGKVEVVQHIGDFKLLDYSMADVKFVPLSDSSGLIAYRLTQKGSSHGKEFSAQIHASALWVERDGKWVCVFSQESPAR